MSILRNQWMGWLLAFPLVASTERPARRRPAKRCSCHWELRIVPNPVLAEAQAEAERILTPAVWRLRGGTTDQVQRKMTNLLPAATIIDYPVAVTGNGGPIAPAAER